MAFQTQYITSLTGVLKIAEIILALLTIIIFRSNHQYFGFSPSLDGQFFGVGVLVSALINTPVLFFCYLFGGLDVTSTTVLEPVINVVLSVLLIISGSMAFGIGGNTIGSLCMITATAYMIDAIFRVCYTTRK